MQQNIQLMIATAITMLFTGCGNSNHHFCSKYEYFYDQLEKPGLPTYKTMKQKLQDEVVKTNSEGKKMMLFVLDEHKYGSKRNNETSRAYCLRKMRWKDYPY